MPEAGSATHFPPTSASSARRDDSSAKSVDSHRSQSPLLRLAADGSIANTANWLSMKNPDSLSASERVIHHNLTLLAKGLDALSQAFIRFANTRMAGKALGKEDVDSDTVEQDKAIFDALDQPEYRGLLRDLMNRLLGKYTKLTTTRGKKATEQAQEFLRLLADVAAQTQADLTANRETGLAEDAAEEVSPSTAVHAQAARMSGDGLMKWVLQLTKQFDMGPKRVTKQAGTGPASKAGSKRKATAEASEEESEESGAEEEEEEREAARSALADARLHKKRKVTGVADDAEEEE
ncbi:hypothetical protein LTR53_003298 [Teratosphaeriaceae sp. CCFEE 6253]|nr:hypothetical protein LTR53_003298 [Teratosphaeriaceae sp. CCFEE 6253]